MTGKFYFEYRILVILLARNVETHKGVELHLKQVAPTYVLLLAVETHAFRCCFGSIVLFFARAWNMEWGA